MNRLKPEQRFQIVEIYLQNQCSVTNFFRALRPFYLSMDFCCQKFKILLWLTCGFNRMVQHHTAGETIDLLKENFHEQIISRNGLHFLCL